MSTISIGERLNRQILRASWDSEVITLEDRIESLENQRSMVLCEQARAEDVWEALDDLYGVSEDERCRY